MRPLWPEQTNLASNFPMFASVLQNYVNGDGEHIDFRIAVTTTGKDMTYSISLGGMTIPMTEHGPDGKFMNNCGVTQLWLDGTTPSLGTTLGCRANVGTGGASYEMPLLMAKHALSERVTSGENAGFNPTDAISFFDTLKGHRSRWAAGVIAGETACTSPGFGKATEATRLKQFVQMTNASGTQQAVFSSICAGNLTTALTDVLAKFQAACGGIIL